MSHFLERLTYLTRRRESFADGLGELRDEDELGGGLSAEVAARQGRTVKSTDRDPGRRARRAMSWRQGGRSLGHLHDTWALFAYMGFVCPFCANIYILYIYTG
jgi:hypothetical protein